MYGRGSEVGGISAKLFLRGIDSGRYIENDEHRTDERPITPGREILNEKRDDNGDRLRSKEIVI
jgi:hypothetical protein